MMLTYQLDEKRKCASLYEHLRNDILSGRLAEGTKLPSKRALAQNLSVSMCTVQQAYEQLASEGYLVSRERSGYFVSSVDILLVRREELPVVSEQAQPSPVEAGLFPFSVWAKLMRKVINDCGEQLFTRTPCDGDEYLKREISSYLYRARGIIADPRYIVIGAGAEYLYGVIVQLLGRDKVYAVEDPGYASIRAAYLLNGAVCRMLPVDETGLSVDALTRSDADVVHLSPSHQFPTGAVMPLSERLRLIDWAKRTGGFIVEDDYDSEFRLSGRPLPSMCGLACDHVIYLNTFSKSLAPSMRMGYMVLPPSLYDRYRRLFEHSASVVPLFEQRTLAEMMASGAFERHLNRLRTHYRAVRQDVLGKLNEIELPHRVSDTGSGLHMTVTFEDEKKGEESLRSLGLHVSPVSKYAVSTIDRWKGTFVVHYKN